MGIYDRYYKVVQMTKLPPDPRVRARALAFAMLPSFGGIFLAFQVSTIVTGLMLGRLLPSGYPERVLPFSFIFWEINYDLGVHYKTHHLESLVHNTFHVAQIAGFFTFIGSLFVAAFAYRAWCSRTDGLTTERGDARWMSPDDMLDVERPEDSLLPDGYDLRRGFSKTHRDERQTRIERAARLRQARQIATEDDLAEEKLNAATVGKP